MKTLFCILSLFLYTCASKIKILSRIYYDQQRNHLTNLKIYVKKGTKSSGIDAN